MSASKKSGRRKINNMGDKQLFEQTAEQKSFMGKILWFCLTNKLVIGLLVVFVIFWGIIVAPFDWEAGGLIRKPVPVDAIPDIGENQQIVFTEWMGRSPQDVDSTSGSSL